MGRDRRGLRAAAAAAFVLSLAACSAEPQLSRLGAAQPPPPAPVAAAAAPAPAPPAATVPLGQARIQLAPIVGSTLDAVAPLSERLAAKARESGFSLANSGDPAATHVLKGYFSVLGEKDGTRVVYVWDVLDKSGNRLHRIQGQETAPGRARGDVWTAVKPETMQAIADRTIAELAAWLAAPAG